MSSDVLACDKVGDRIRLGGIDGEGGGGGGVNDGE